MSIKNPLKPGEPYRLNFEASRTLTIPINRNLKNPGKVSEFDRQLSQYLPKNGVKKMTVFTNSSFRDIGELSKKFESGNDGVSAIGYDPNGGTSYGAYQISSRQGTMDEFIRFLEEREPKWANKLKAAGPSNTFGTNGAMPRAWREIAEENPQKFLQLQKEFVIKNHYEPALELIKKETNIDLSRSSNTLQEVLFSTAVQHGATGGANIFIKGIKKLVAKGKPISEKDLIDEVYAIRSTRFGSSPENIRASVQKRLQNERTDALQLLAKNQSILSKKA